ncbi:hypothetical protein [Arthrobacter sp. UYCu712]|uniref:hypothetical protein n=1 Tax=Arthrobacter sp. UYCu712 TaxID=3156340 RepID=UPI0033989F57
MEHSTPVLINTQQRAADRNFLAEANVHPPLAVVNLLAPSVRRRAILGAQVSCVALIFAALVVAAAYILIPLALAVHSAVHPVPLTLVIAAAVLTELALIVTFIVLKTEGPAE